MHLMATCLPDLRSSAYLSVITIMLTIIIKIVIRRIIIVNSNNSINNINSKNSRVPLFISKVNKIREAISGRLSCFVACAGLVRTLGFKRVFLVWSSGLLVKEAWLP